MGVPQPNAVAKATSVPNLTDPSKPATNAAASTADAPAAKKPSTVAQIPTSAEAVAGLRQPLSVLDPNATPGPINLTVGYDSERTAASPAGGVQAATTNGARTPNRPSGAQGESREEQVVAARTSGRAAPSAALETPNRNDLERRDEATSDNSARPARLPAKPPVADQGRTAQREIEDIQSEPDSEPAPKKKSLLGNVTGWIGAKLNDQPNETDELQAENSPRYEETPESKKPAKKMFPRIRALFGEAPEMLPPDDAQLQVDRDVVPSKAEEIDSANKVRTSGFDAAAREQDEAGAPRPLNLPRTNEAGGGEAKPLAETRTFTEAKSVDTERPIAPSAAAQRPARFTSAVNAEAPEATVEKTAAQPAKTTSGQSSPTSRPAPKSTERLSAGESFYNRMVR
jgi:hypothetical protein